MRRRLTFTIATVVSTTLLIAGIGVALILQANVVHVAVRQLTAEVRAISLRVNATNPNMLRFIRLAATLDGAKIVPLDQVTGTPLASLPNPLKASILNPNKLLSGYGQSGTYHDVAYAALPLNGNSLGGRRTLNLLVITRALPPIGKALGFLLIVVVASILIAFIVAEFLTYRFTKPILALVKTTRDIADGNLSTRISEPNVKVPELAQLGDSINLMAEKLRKSSEAETQFLLAISHDLRTPMTSIKGYAEAIIDHALEPESAAKIILTQSDRLSRLVKDLLDLAKIRASSFSMNMTQMTPIQITDQVASTMAIRMRDVGLSFHYQGFKLDEPLKVEVDPDRLVQVLSNLAENAYKFATSSVAFICSAKGGEVVFTIEDDGPGIPASASGILFEKPYHLGDSRARESGSGLGLLISAGLVRAMRGRIWYDSPTLPNGGGTRMNVALRAKL